MVGKFKSRHRHLKFCTPTLISYVYLTRISSQLSVIASWLGNTRSFFLKIDKQCWVEIICLAIKFIENSNFNEMEFGTDTAFLTSIVTGIIGFIQGFEIWNKSTIYGTEKIFQHIRVYIQLVSTTKRNGNDRQKILSAMICYRFS